MVLGELSLIGEGIRILEQTHLLWSEPCAIPSEREYFKRSRVHVSRGPVFALQMSGYETKNMKHALRR
jgi:hypothetical protein